MYTDLGSPKIAENITLDTLDVLTTILPSGTYDMSDTNNANDCDSQVESAIIATEDQNPENESETSSRLYPDLSSLQMS